MRKVVVLFGLSGSGKSFIGSILRELGYEHIRSDEIRKELARIPLTQSAKAPFGKGIYTQEMTKRVYEELIRRAKRALSEGKSVVLDATFLRRWQRKLAKEHFPDALFILVKASDETIRKRLSERKDISDADISVYEKQKEIFEEPSDVEHVVLNTEKEREEIKKELLSILGS
ncbi:MAG: AAA family ATPase [Aquificae bacterium]|nr:AAA family ATPase [Aquificota bacterium]